MPNVKFTAALTRFFPNLQEEKIAANSVAELFTKLEKKYPGLSDYILTEEGSLRKHVNIFIGEALIKDKTALQDELSEDAEVLIFQALSGG